MRKLTQILKKTIEHKTNTDAVVYLFSKYAAQFFSVLNISKNKRMASIYAKIFYQGVKNAEHIPAKLDAIWPFWVYKQFDPNFCAYLPSGFQPTIINNTFRNWTTLSYPNVDEKVIVDPSGLVTPFNGGWSLDFWLMYNNQIYAPSKLSNVTQELIENKPLIKTFFTVEGIKVNITTFFKYYGKEENLLFNEVEVENTAKKLKEFSLIFALRPYNPDGVSKIEEILFLSSKVFVINNQLGLVFDEKPNNIICASLNDGDISQYLTRWDMILKSKCKEGQASACAEFKISLNPKEKRIISAKIPPKENSKLLGIMQKTLNLAQINFLKKRILNIQSKNIEEEKQKCLTDWKKIDENLPSFTLPDKNIERIFNQNLAHIHNFIGKNCAFAGSFNYKEMWIRDAVFIILALNRLGSIRYSEEILKELFSSKKIFLNQDEFDNYGQILYCLWDTFSYNQNKVFLEKIFPYIDRIVVFLAKNRVEGNIRHAYLNGLLKPSYSFDTKGKKDYYLWDNFWAYSGIKAAREIATVLKKEEKMNEFSALEKSYLEAINNIISGLFEKQINTPYIPISPTEGINSKLIFSLVSVYPLKIFEADNIFVKNTVEYIEKNFLYNNVFYNTTGHAGLGTYLNGFLAQVYLAQNNPRVFDILNWLTDIASTTGCWPEAIHPNTKGGIVGDGHYGLASAEYLQLVRHIIIKEEENKIELTPLIPKEWLATNNLISAKNITTKFGKVSFSYYFTKNKVSIHMDNEFHTPPKDVIIHLPISIKKMAIDSVKEKEIYSYFVNVPPLARKIEIDLMES